MAVERLSLVAMGKTEVLGPWFSSVNALLKAASLYFGPSLPSRNFRYPILLAADRGLRTVHLAFVLITCLLQLADRSFIVAMGY